MELPHDDVGQGPAVLLLHAGIADRTMWSEYLQPLAGAGFRVVAADLPGFGQAAAPALEDAPWNDVLATMDALNIERATLVGNSFGGAVALRVAALAPQRIGALALISSPAPGVDPSPALAAAWQSEEAALERGDIDAAVDAVLKAWLAVDAPAALRGRVAEMQRRAFELQIGVAGAPEGDDPLESDPDGLSRVGAPALIAVGEHDMPDFHLAAEALARALPGARRSELAGAGHLAPLEQPEQFRDMLLSFLL
jgi:pimeloyl-ACP methyl ester carboxylesterase